MKTARGDKKNFFGYCRSQNLREIGQRILSRVPGSNSMSRIGNAEGPSSMPRGESLQEGHRQLQRAQRQLQDLQEHFSKFAAQVELERDAARARV